MASKKKGKVLTGFNVGSFALWRLYPNFQISLDGRYEEVYPDDTVYMVQSAINDDSPEGSAALNKLSPDFILLELDHKEIPNRFADWKTAYIDTQFMILAKTEGTTTPVSSNANIWVSSF